MLGITQDFQETLLDELLSLLRKQSVCALCKCFDLFSPFHLTSMTKNTVLCFIMVGPLQSCGGLDVLALVKKPVDLWLINMILKQD